MRTREQVDLELIDDNPWQPRASFHIGWRLNGARQR